MDSDDDDRHPPPPPVLPTSLSPLKRLQCQGQEKARILAAKVISEGLQVKTKRDETVGLAKKRVGDLIVGRWDRG